MPRAAGRAHHSTVTLPAMNRPVRLLSAVLLLAPSLAAAQGGKPAARDTTARDSVAVIPPIEVVGSVRPFAGPQVGSGIPARVTELSGAAIDQWEPRVFSDVLGQLAGFSTYDDLGSGYKLNVSTRGFYASPVVGLPQGVSVFVDGVRQNEPDAAQVNWDLIPMEHVKRVEVLSGNGTLAGRNSLGGAINLVTNRGEGPVGGQLELQGGSYSTFSAEGSVGGRSRGGLDYYVGGGYNREDGWRQVTGAEQFNGFVNVGRLGERGGLRLQAYYADSRAETAGSLPESVYETKPDSNLSAQDYEDLSQLQLALLGYRQAGQGRFSFNTFFRASEAERFNANQPGDPDVFGTGRNRSFGGTVDYRWGGSLGDLPLGVRVGLDGSTNSTRVQLFADSAKFGGDRTQTTLVESPVWDLAGFVGADLTTGRATWSAGARLDYVKAPFYNRLDPARDTTQTFSRLNPRIGVNVDAGRGVSLFGSWGQAMRAPSVIEIACADPEEPCPLPFALGDDPPIDPVVAQTFEFGARWQQGRLDASASVYRTSVKDEIVLFPYDEANEPEGSTIDGYFGNIEKTRREGVEASLAYRLRGGHLLYGNYAYTKATYRVEDIELFSIREEFGGENEIEVGDRLPLVPDHQVKLGARFVLPAGFDAGFDARFIGNQVLRGDEANEEEPLDSYFVTDLRAGWRRGPVEVNAIVNNLFDTQYATFGTFNINQGAPGGPALERFLTPGQVRFFRVAAKWYFGAGDRD